jgi:O-Antigen ligase
VPILERLSKTAALVSVLLIVGLLLTIHPDITTTLRVLAIASIAIGLCTPASLRHWLHAAWIVAAMLSPALLRAVTDREGPVLDLFWMAGMSASLLRTASWAQWRLPAQWRVFAGSWALVVSLAWPVLLARETGFDLRVLRDEGAINSWAMLSAPQVAAWLLFTVWTPLLGLLWLEWAYQQFNVDPARISKIAHGVWIGATIASLAALYQGTIDLGFLSTPFWASLARATGTLLDANAFGMCAALAGPFALLALRQTVTINRAPGTPASNAESETRVAIAFAVFVVNIAGLWMSGSRTAVLCSVVATSVCAVAVWPRLTRRARAVVPWAAMGLVAIVATIVIGSNTVGPARRLADIPASMRSALSTVFTRGPYGQIATQMIREHPLIGIGIGSYQVLSPDYWRRQANDALPFDNAQNWWRHQIAELGFLGSAPLLIWSALIAWQVVTARARPDRRVEAIIVRGLVAAVGISSLIQVPTQTPIVMVTFTLLLAWMSALTLPASTTGRAFTLSRWTWACVVMLAVAYAGGHLKLAAGSLSVNERARQAQRQYVVGTYRPEVVDGQEFSWTKGDAQFVWPAKTRYLVVRVWAQHPDLGSNPVRVTLTSPCGVLLNEALKTPTPISLGITLPEGQRALEARLHVSRTWRPSDHGSDDERVLGAGIVAEFVTDPRLAVEQNRVVALTACRPGI